MPRRQNEIAGELAEVARELEAEASPAQTWQRIAELAVKMIDGCEYAGISLTYPKRLETAAATDDVVRRVDALQYKTGEGPCLQSMRDEDTIVSGDLTAEDRWPRFARRAAAETGIRSMLAFRLFVRGDTLGALNLYSRRTSAFDEGACSVGALFAAHAALAMSSAQEHETARHLEEALESNRLIGVALGILMHQSEVDRHQAFAILRSASQRRNVKVRDLAETVVQSLESRVS